MKEPLTDSQLKQRGFRATGRHPEYKYLSIYENHKGEIMYKASIPPSIIKGGWSSIFEEARAGAKSIDVRLIKSGLSAVNVLKKVS